MLGSFAVASIARARVALAGCGHCALARRVALVSRAGTPGRRTRFRAGLPATIAALGRQRERPAVRWRAFGVWSRSHHVIGYGFSQATAGHGPRHQGQSLAGAHRDRSIFPCDNAPIRTFIRQGSRRHQRVLRYLCGPQARRRSDTRARKPIDVSRQHGPCRFDHWVGVGVDTARRDGAPTHAE